MSRKIVQSLLVIAWVSLMCARQTFANTVSIATGVAGWTIDSFNNSDTVGPTTAYGPPVFHAAAPLVTNPNPGWTGGAAVQAHDTEARWIGPTADSGAHGSYGFYTYKLELTIPPLIANTTYALNGWFSSDNLVSSFTINGNAATIASINGQTIYGFQSEFTVGPNSGTSPIDLLVTVYNESTHGHAIGMPDGPSDPNSSDNPTGLIIAGNVTAVPLPAAVWGGMALIGLISTPKLRRLRDRLALV